MQMNEPQRFRDVLASIKPLPRRQGTALTTQWSDDDIYVIDMITHNVLERFAPSRGAVTVQPGTLVMRGLQARYYFQGSKPTALSEPPKFTTWWAHGNHQRVCDLVTGKPYMVCSRDHEGTSAGFWWISETRTDGKGNSWERWAHKCVMDDFGALVEVKP